MSSRTIYTDVPCKNYDKCGNLVSRELSQIKRGVEFICPECREERNREYKRIYDSFDRKLLYDIKKRLLSTIPREQRRTVMLGVIKNKKAEQILKELYSPHH